jgi:1-acyl-sn-glycerol-3-phosphate acyltransferase
MNTTSDFISAYGSRSLAVLRLMALLTLVAALVPVQVIYRFLRPSDPFRIPQIFHRTIMRILGFRVRMHGAMASPSPVLFVANHASYLDIPILSALIPSAFAAKAEVNSWPLIGFLARLQNTIFIERRAMRAEQQRGLLRDQLARRQNLVIFPEGTSTDGLKVLPFKSSLFAIAEEGLADIGLMVQPVSIACTGLDGMPITRGWRPFYAWYGDMTLAPHLWNVLKLGHFTIDVIFHPPVQPQAFADRKALAQYCHQQVARGIEQCLKGRELAPPPLRLEAPQPALP